MISYSDIQKHCEDNSVLSKPVIDDFLIYYAADKENLDRQMDAVLKKYKKVVREIPVAYINFLKAEYIAHRIFRQGGYILKYLNRPEIRNLPQEKYRYLEFLSHHPWRFSFARIVHKPANAFFEMEDVFTQEQYLLYSPGMQKTEEEEPVQTWFNLIAYNGKCWQTYGLIIQFKSFTADDLFFFATELNPDIEDGDMLMREVENNPFPFFMLLSASNLPVIVSRGHLVLFCRSDDLMENFSSEKLAADFTTEWNKNVYMFTLKKPERHPHFATAYYNEQKQELLRTAMTISGFEELTRALIKAGFDLDLEADIVVSPSMLSAIKNILNKKIEIDPYEEMFSKQTDEDESEEMKRWNHFFELALPFYNANMQPDIKLLAEEAGISEEKALSLWTQLKKNVDETLSKY